MPATSVAHQSLERPQPKRRRTAVLRFLLLALGVALFAAVFRSVGWPAISANLSRIGPWFAALVAIYTLAQLAFALGWWAVLDPRPRLSAFPALFGTYLSGDSANALGPGNVAGEPLKVHLLRREIGGAAAVASVTIHKHAELLAQWVFLVIGVSIALLRFPMPGTVRAAALLTTAGLGAALLLMSWVLPRRTFSPIVRRLSRWKRLAGPLARFEASARKVDGQISSFYVAHPRRFAAATLLCFAGWCGGLFETWLVLRLLAPGRGWIEAFAIEGLAMTLNNIFLFIPGRIGSAEGVRVAVFLVLGLTAAQGAAYALVRRGREIVWIVPGLLLLLLPRRSRSAESPALPPASGTENGR